MTLVAKYFDGVLYIVFNIDLLIIVTFPEFVDGNTFPYPKVVTTVPTK